MTKLRFIQNKYTINITMNMTSSSGIYTTIYHSGSYLLLFGIKKFHVAFLMNEVLDIAK